MNGQETITIEGGHFEIKIEDRCAIVRGEADGEDDEGRYYAMDAQHARSAARALLAAAQEINPQELGYEEGELAQLLSEAEERLAHMRERVAKFRAKLDSAIEHVRSNAIDRRAELMAATELLQETQIHEGQAHEHETGKMLHHLDEMRRAYAMYDALRSVPLWLDFQ